MILFVKTVLHASGVIKFGNTNHCHLQNVVTVVTRRHITMFFVVALRCKSRRTVRSSTLSRQGTQVGYSRVLAGRLKMPVFHATSQEVHLRHRVYCRA